MSQARRRLRAALLTSFLCPVLLSAGTLAPPAIILTDAAGRAVRLPALPRRIAVIGNGPYIIAHMLYMFPEGRERLYAMEKKGRSASEFLPLIDPGFEKKVFFAPNPGPEAIAEIRPDLILTRGAAAGAKDAALAAVGLPVFHLGLETPEQYERDIRNLGELLGNPGRAGEIASYFKTKTESVAAALQGLKEEKKPRVMLALAIARGGKIAVEIPALQWMQTIQVKLAGGSPVWQEAAERTSGWTVVNLEQIARWNPDQIVVVFWHSMDPRKSLDDLRTDKLWSALKAVRTGRLYAFPADHYGWDTPDPRWILGLIWLAARFHPDRFPNYDVKREISAFYGKLFGMDGQAVEAKVLPSIRTDLR